MKKIRVLVVDDSLLFRRTIVEGITQHPDIEVVAVASNPYEARDCILKFKPDVMTLDVEMPRMDGISFLSKLMPQYPMPVIMVSAVDNKVFEAMKLGAIDFIVKTNIASNNHLSIFINELINKIIIASTAKIQVKQKPITEPLIDKIPVKKNSGPIKLIVLGASTGGIEATERIVTKLPNSIPPMLIVQHMPSEFTRMYANRLNLISKPRILEAQSGDILEDGHIYIAKGGQHMKIVKTETKTLLHLFDGEKVNGHIPSVDVLFNSVTKHYSKNCLAIILTGMGNDGAKGILKLHNLGSKTIGQDQATSVVYGMPKVAYDLGAIDIQLPIDSIANLIISLTESL